MKCTNPEQVEFWITQLKSHIAGECPAFVSEYSVQLMKNIVMALDNPCIVLEYKVEALEKQLVFFDCLKAAGVDNWEGYEYAIEMYNEEN
ncbi:MAG: hypothetical protein JHC33_07740 [Ignisphaera sp.]|nr:hypothetical protein [Ignisphaera sp.]